MVRNMQTLKPALWNIIQNTKKTECLANKWVLLQDGALPQTAQVVTSMSADTGGTPVI